MGRDAPSEMVVGDDQTVLDLTAHMDKVRSLVAHLYSQLPVASHEAQPQRTKDKNEWHHLYLLKYAVIEPIDEIRQVAGSLRTKDCNPLTTTQLDSFLALCSSDWVIGPSSSDKAKAEWQTLLNGLNQNLLNATKLRRYDFLDEDKINLWCVQLPMFPKARQQKVFTMKITIPDMRRRGKKVTFSVTSKSFNLLANFGVDPLGGSNDVDDPTLVGFYSSLYYKHNGYLDKLKESDGFLYRTLVDKCSKELFVLQRTTNTKFAIAKDYDTALALFTSMISVESRLMDIDAVHKTNGKIIELGIVGNNKTCVLCDRRSKTEYSMRCRRRLIPCPCTHYGGSNYFYDFGLRQTKNTLVKYIKEVANPRMSPAKCYKLVDMLEALINLCVTESFKERRTHPKCHKCGNVDTNDEAIRSESFVLAYYRHPTDMTCTACNHRCCTDCGESHFDEGFCRGRPAKEYEEILENFPNARDCPWCGEIPSKDDMCHFVTCGLCKRHWCYNCRVPLRNHDQYSKNHNCRVNPRNLAYKAVHVFNGLGEQVPIEMLPLAIEGPSEVSATQEANMRRRRQLPANFVVQRQ